MTKKQTTQKYKLNSNPYYISHMTVVLKCRGGGTTVTMITSKHTYDLYTIIKLPMYTRLVRAQRHIYNSRYRETIRKIKWTKKTKIHNFFLYTPKLQRTVPWAINKIYTKWFSPQQLISTKTFFLNTIYFNIVSLLTHRWLYTNYNTHYSLLIPNMSIPRYYL